MDPKAEGTCEPIYEDFQPSASWVREEANILEVHLPDFKKDHLKIQLDNLSTLKIRGERPLDRVRRSRFCMNISIPKNIKNSELHAKFINGVLYIVLPKTTTRVTIEDQPPQPQLEVPANQTPDETDTELEENKEQVTEPTVDKPSDESNAKTEPIVAEKPNGSMKYGFCLRLKKPRRLQAVNVAVSTALVVAFGAYVVYRLGYFSAEDGN